MYSAGRKIWQPLLLLLVGFDLLFLAFIGFAIKTSNATPLYFSGNESGGIVKFMLLQAVSVFPFAYLWGALNYLPPLMMRFLIFKKPETNFWKRLLYFPITMWGGLLFVTVLKIFLDAPQIEGGAVVVEHLRFSFTFFDVLTFAFLGILLGALELKAHNIILTYRGEAEHQETNTENSSLHIPLWKRFAASLLMIIFACGAYWIVDLFFRETLFG